MRRRYKKSISINNVRTILYTVAKALGHVNAILKGRVGLSRKPSTLLKTEN